MTSRPPATSGSQRAPLRADARRNRERVLEAADAVFSEIGPTASTEEVARRAGVAIGTVFRHFPTKEVLIEAVVVGRLTQLTDEAERLAGAEDADAALLTFFRRWIELSAAKYQFATALAHSGADVREIRSTHPEVVHKLHGAVGVLLTRAQRAGGIRRDLGASDLVALMVGASRAHEHVGPDAEQGARLLSVAIGGLRRPRPKT
jgi:AcrR family transcriptional regulator